MDKPKRIIDMEDRLFEIHNDNSFEPIFQNGSVVQALNRVKNCLNYSLKEEYGIEDSEITNKFLKLHGLDKDRFDFINNFEALIEQGIADNSIDTNANKGETSITGLLAETAMPINKLVGYRYLYRKMKEMYGKKRAKYLAGKMYDMSLALADSTNILKPYCWSVNASKLVLEGRPWGTLPSLPPKHLSSYTSCLAEVLHQLSNHLAGAIAVGSFFLDLAHMMIYGDKKTLSDLKGTDYRKSVENALQSFIHSMNHLSRNSVESPFTNISIMDTIKLRSLIDDDNMGWYFENDKDLFGVPTEAIKDCGEMEWKEYIIKCILELEEIYMEIMDRGDLCHDGRPITFPVSTLNISRQENADGTYDFADKEFLNNICKNHDIMRYNIYVSSGNKLASCCFSGDQMFTYFEEDGTPVLISFEDFVNTYLKEGETEKHITDSKAFVKEPLDGKLVPITGVMKIKNEFKKLITFEFEDGSKIKATPNQKFYDNNSKTLVTAKEIAENPEKFDI